MIETLPHLRQFIRQVQQVPYLASKNLYRVTEYFLQLDSEKTDQFIAALVKAKQQQLSIRSTHRRTSFIRLSNLLMMKNNLAGRFMK